ncbi:MAG TPA: hypothetical protein VGH82_12165 [Gaiellaceae bacterium]|jgi:plasmid stabilization system protein ParE
MGRGNEHTLERVLVAIATNEQVSSSLRGYRDRDHAIEQLEADMASQRRELIQELLAVARKHSAAPVAARMIRDEFIVGLRDS